MKKIILLVMILTATQAQAQGNAMIQALLGAYSTCLPIATSGWTPEAANIVGLWHLDEAAGAATVADASGRGNTGTRNGGTLGSEGKVGTSIALNGTSNYIGMGNSAPLNLKAALTIVAWVKPTSASPGSDSYIVSKAGDGVGAIKYFQLKQTSAGRYQGSIFDGNGDSQAIATSPVGTTVAGQWQHVAYVYDGTEGRIYLDGVRRTTTAYVRASSGTSTTVAFQIGARTPVASSFFPGSIDEVAIWSTALTDAQIKLLYDQQSCSRN